MYSMTTYFKEIETILIHLDFNIKTDSETFLTRSILNYKKQTNVDTSKWSDLPYFTTTSAFSFEDFKNKSYEEVIQIFFDLKTFQALLKNKQPIIQNNETVITTNVLTMLKLLLPTYPISNQIYSSVNKLSSKSKTLFNLNASNKQINNKSPLSLEINSKEYSVQNAVWLNDIFHHPKYSEIISNFENFRYWQESTREELNGVIALERYNIKPIVEEQIQLVRQFYKTIPPTVKAEYTRKYKLEDTLRNVEILINDKKQESFYDDVTLQKIINNVVHIMNEMKTKAEISFNDNTTINKYAKNQDYIKSFYIQNAILYKYFNNKIDFSFKNDSEEVIAYLTDHYSKYIEFGKQLQELSAPFLKSTNPAFQDPFDRFLRGIDNDFEHLVLDANNSYNSDTISEKIRNFINVGVSVILNPKKDETKANNTKYEIFLKLNLLEHSNTVKQETDNNTQIALKTCNKSNEELVSLFSELHSSKYSTGGSISKRKSSRKKKCLFRTQKRSKK